MTNWDGITTKVGCDSHKQMLRKIVLVIRECPRTAVHGLATPLLQPPRSATTSIRRAVQIAVFSIAARHQTADDIRRAGQSPAFTFRPCSWMKPVAR